VNDEAGDADCHQSDDEEVRSAGQPRRAGERDDGGDDRIEQRSRRPLGQFRRQRRRGHDTAGRCGVLVAAGVDAFNRLVGLPEAQGHAAFMPRTD
jgi:hypothetical protein